MITPRDATPSRSRDVPPDHQPNQAHAGPPAIAGAALRVCRRGREALRLDDIMVPAGDFLGLAGPNGSGKSTLLACLAGLLRPASGDLRVLGTTVDMARRRVALVTQLQALDPRLPISVLESVLVGTHARLGLFRRPGPSEHRLAMDMLALTGVDHLAKRPLGQCSGGEIQRVAIARALTRQPSLLLLDEPTSALDWLAQQEIMSCLMAIHARFGMTVVMATHDVDALQRWHGRVLALREGRAVWRGPVEEATTPEALRAIFGREPIDAMEMRHGTGTA